MDARLSIVVACAGGALMGLLYTLSPMTVWFGVSMIPLFLWAGSGLGRRERVWVFGLLASAVVLRVLAVGVLFLASPQDGAFSVLIPDEGHMGFRARALRYIALDVPLSRQDYADSASLYGQSGLHYVHAYLQLLIGETPYAIRLLHSALYLTGCVALYRTVRPVFGAPAALGGLAIVLFLPSLFVWSITYLKDPPYAYLTAFAVAAAVAGMRRDSRWGARVLAWSLVACVLAAVHSVRPGGEFIVAGGLGIGVVGTFLLGRPRLLSVVLAACLAGTAVGLQVPRVQQVATGLLAQAARNHVGFITSGGWTYKVLDPEFYTRMDDGAAIPIERSDFTLASSARYIVRATASFFLIPFPWSGESWSVAAYLPEQLVWDLLLVLALVGVVAGLRLDVTLTITLAAVIVVGAVAIGMTSGNVGTLVRHRAMVTLLIPWLGSLGACEVLAWAARFRRGVPRQDRTAIQQGEMRAAY